MSEFWLVEVDNPNRLMMRRRRIWHSIVEIEGVTSLTDLRAITLETLAALLMSDEEFAAGMAELRTKRNKGSSEAIRRYWKRIRQPQLPGLN